MVPNWNSDAYLTAAEKLIAALGARYNKDERVEWFEFSGYGDWSENHIGFVAKELGAPTPWPEESVAQLGYYDQYHDQAITKSSITRLVDATLSAFPDTRIIVAAGNPEITRQFLAASHAQPVGIRGDCLGVIAPTQYWATDPDSWYVHHDKQLVSDVLARWKSAPVVTEWCNFQPDGMTHYFEKALKDVVNYPCFDGREQCHRSTGGLARHLGAREQVCRIPLRRNVLDPAGPHRGRHGSADHHPLDQLRYRTRL